MTNHLLNPPAPPLDPPSSSGPDAIPPDRSRAGALWVTALGAFLLFAAAGVFVAVQWDHIPDAFKLGVLGALSGGFLLAGRRLRPTLPAAGSVLYHLGTFLIPVVSAAVAVNQQATWPTMLLIEGAVATIAFWSLNRVERSVVLDWATVAAVVVLAGGIGACTPVPAPVALLAMGLAAEVRRRHGAAIAWSLVVGLAPLGALIAGVVPIGSGVLADLGLVGGASRLATAVVGLGAAALLARNAGRRHDLLLVVLAGTAALLGLASGWVAVAPTALMTVTGLAGLFLVVEVVARATTSDQFWARPAAVVASSAEIVTGLLMATAVWTTVAVYLHQWSHEQSITGVGPLLIVAGGLAAGGWLVADLRRREADCTPMGIALLTGSGWMPATIGMAGSVMAGIAVGTGSMTITGMAALVIAATLVVSGRPAGGALAVFLAAPAPLLAHGSPALAAGFALVGGLVIAWAAVLRSPNVRSEVDAQGVWLLALMATGPVLSAGLVTVDTVSATVCCLAAVGLLWCTALVLDRGEVGPRTAGLGLIPRGASALTLVVAPVLRPGGVCLLATVLAALTLLDALARRRPWMAMATGVLVPIAVASGAIAAGGTLGQAALAVVALAPIACAVDVLVARSWSWPFRVTIAASLLGAGLLAGSDLPALATVIMVVGGIGLVYGQRLEVPELAWLGGVLVGLGTWLHLLDHHVRATEPYLVPVAVALLVAGWQGRRATSISSWVAYGPAVALLGGSALVERLAGGGAAHALVAGLVALVAVIVGARQRLIAPLVIGTALLVALTVHESLTVTATVPTWAWLALGGATLVGAGIGMERAETGPMETGRRVVDVVSERFT